MFEEREKDRVERDKLEKLENERLQEIKKNESKFNDDLAKKAIILNYEGKIVKIKSINEEKLGIYKNVQNKSKIPSNIEKLLELKYKENKGPINYENLLLEELKSSVPECFLSKDYISWESLKKVETSLQDYLFKRNNNSQKEFNPKSTLVFPPSNPEIAINYFQPNPLNFYEFSDGVEFDFYGKKKKGIKYPSLPGKMTKDEYTSLCSQYAGNIIRDKNIYSDTIPESAIETMSKKSDGIKLGLTDMNMTLTKRKLMNLFINDDGEKEIMLGKNTGNLFKKDKLSKKENLLRIKSKQKAEKKKLIKDLVKKDDKYFKYENIQSSDDKAIYEYMSNPINRNPDSLYINNKKSVLRLPVTANLKVKDSLKHTHKDKNKKNNNKEED